MNLEQHNQQLHTTYAPIILTALVVISLALRLALALSGGQYFRADELRAKRAIQAVEFAEDGRMAEAGRVLFSVSHPGYVAIAIPATALAKLFYPEDPELSRAMAAILSLFSVANIIVVYLLAQRVGGGRAEALLASFFMATSTTMFYYSRHLLPYDISIFFALTGLWVSLHKDVRAKHILLGGFLFSISLAVYAGYWMILFILGLVVVFQNPTSDIVLLFRRALTRGIGLVLGFMGSIVLVLILAIGSGANLSNFLSRSREFSGTVDWGVYSEGWSMPWEFLWYTEGFLFVIMLIGVSMALYQLWHDRSKIERWYWPAVLVATYVLFVVVSTVLEMFVLYGRLIRQLVPVLILSAAFGYSVLFTRNTRLFRGLQIALVIITVGLAVNNFITVFELKYPRDEEPRVAAEYGDSLRARLLLTPWTGPEPELYEWELSPSLDELAIDASESRYLLLNFDDQWYFFEDYLPLPSGEIVYQEPHPLRYKPYQFEGYDPSQRELLDTLPIDMMVIDLASGSQSASNPQTP